MCANAVGLLLAFVGRAFSSPLTNGGGGGGSTIARSSLMHLEGVGRVDLVHYSTCLRRLARVVASPVHPGDRDNNDCNSGGPEWSG